MSCDPRPLLPIRNVAEGPRRRSEGWFHGEGISGLLNAKCVHRIMLVPKWNISVSSVSGDDLRLR